ncbi:M3 family oligoendopeptidase [uncultured Clostridium sp.]|jgi:pepF/M3 family oligoendopeptidase|uniref:M3 family oligoendopeptidase n=1 Tax=uncultured Clostridium sp. TaxID=59620 RepID=UPI00261D4CFE|nr:M3 family oligoendopeptidase [uncultured Clostridium sp.]
MEVKWSLDELYTGFDSEKFKNDYKKLENIVANYKGFADSIIDSDKDIVQRLERYIKNTQELEYLTSDLFLYTQLTLSVDTKNEVALKTLENLQKLVAKTADTGARISKWIGNIDNIEVITEKSELLKDHSFHLIEIKESSKYILSDKEELMIAKMQTTGSSAFEKLMELETSSLLVDIELNGEKKQMPLTMVRNLAYDKDPEVRKIAYFAELKAYEKIENSVAASLCGIKGEVITTCEARGFESPLQDVLLKSRMSKKTLDAMLSAMKESLPVFEKFFKRKGEMLGHKNGLPFYDMFAPLEGGDKTYTLEEAKAFVFENFGTFSDRLRNFAETAFDKKWVDVYPREGKVGGAFCQGVHSLKESRVMLNFGGNFTDITTMAHELGHGYHGECLKDESVINADYPMPIAETASTFCETIVKKAAIKNSEKKVAFSILEAELSDCAQIIVDILSRFLFESELFERRKNGSLSAKELKEIMIDAQKKSYGNGLDNDFLHPYMWACKPHYYSAYLNFYNFPYAFGLLFAKGLYAEYLNKGEEFVKDYDKLLAVTGKNKLADVTKLMNIDIESEDFWRNSLKTIEEDIEEFIKLSKEI